MLHRAFLVMSVLIVAGTLALHVGFQLKTCTDADVLDVSFRDRSDWERACDVRLPMLCRGLDGRAPPRLSAVAEVLEQAQDRAETRDQTTHLALEDALDLAASDQVRVRCRCSHPRGPLHEWLRPPLTAWSRYEVEWGTDGVCARFRPDRGAHRTYLVSAALPGQPREIGDTTVSVFPPGTSQNVQVQLRPGQVLYVPAFWSYDVIHRAGAAVQTYRFYTHMSALAGGLLWAAERFATSGVVGSKGVDPGPEPSLEKEPDATSQTQETADASSP